jgi:hypothetical protein
MSEQNSVVKDSGSFSFGILVFSICILIPIIVFSGWAYTNYLQNEAKMECLKSGRTFINDLCIQITK